MSSPEVLPPVDWVAHLPGDPVAAFREFLAGWYADVPPVGHARIDAPPPLAAFFEAAAGRREILTAYNELLGPAEWEKDDSGLWRFAVANQGSWSALFDPAEEDPPVWYWGMSSELLPERCRLSGFLMQFALTQVAMCGPALAMGEIEREQLTSLLAPLRQVPLPAASHPADVTHHYVGPGLVVVLMEYPDGRFEVYCGSRWRSPLRLLRALDVDWDVFHG